MKQHSARGFDETTLKYIRLRTAEERNRLPLANFTANGRAYRTEAPRLEFGFLVKIIAVMRSLNLFVSGLTTANHNARPPKSSLSELTTGPSGMRISRIR